MGTPPTFRENGYADSGSTHRSQKSFPNPISFRGGGVGVRSGSNSRREETKGLEHAFDFEIESQALLAVRLEPR